MEAARVDGASEFFLFFRIILPLGLPAIASLAIFQVLFVWNDLLIGITLAQDNTPIAPTIAQQLRQFGSNLDVLAPASFFSAVIPLTVFAMFQRYFVQGLLAGSVK
jgi:alpha-glucoside transport system permease protein